MKKCKVGIMTFFRVNNFGAVLQSYALSKTLDRLGYDAEIIDYQCPFLEKPYRWENLHNKGIFAFLTSFLGFLTRFPRNQKFLKFRKKNLCVSEKTYCRENVDEAKYDLIVVGSDQIWNLEATNGDDRYLCEGFSKKIPKCTYAASFGKDEIEERWIETLRQGLQNFQRITCREESGTKFVNKIVKDKNCQTMIDPVFLLSKEDWEKIATKPKIADYVLVYQQSITKTVVEVARYLARENNLKIIFIPFPMGKISFGKCKTNYSPKEWLGLIQNAAYVVTDSFHGTAFSIVMNKEFFVSTCGTGPKTGGRIHGLLAKMNLQNRYIECGDEIQGKKDMVNWKEVNEIIKEERKCAIDYLMEIKKYVSE